jgi:hypothetical protein
LDHEGMSAAGVNHRDPKRRTLTWIHRKLQDIHAEAGELREDLRNLGEE